MPSPKESQDTEAVLQLTAIYFERSWTSAAFGVHMLFRVMVRPALVANLVSPTKLFDCPNFLNSPRENHNENPGLVYLRE